MPSDGFGGMSPEKKASEHLRALFTFVAAKVVLAQLEGSGRGSNAAYDYKAFKDLSETLQSVPIKDAEQWLGVLMARNSMLAVRIMEVRAAYTAEDFEWHTLQRIANRDMAAANERLLRKHAESMFRVAGGAGEGGPAELGEKPKL